MGQSHRHAKRRRCEDKGAPDHGHDMDPGHANHEDLESKGTYLCDTCDGVYLECMFSKRKMKDGDYDCYWCLHEKDTNLNMADNQLPKHMHCKDGKSKCGVMYTKDPMRYKLPNGEPLPWLKVAESWEAGHKETQSPW